MNVELCDDCGEEYPGPAYYTWDDPCQITSYEVGDTVGTPVPHECTFNHCPDCAEDTVPDDPQDPRWIIDTHERADLALWVNDL